MASTYGIEAALRVIEKEIRDVFAVYGKRGRGERSKDPSVAGQLCRDVGAVSVWPVGDSDSDLGGQVSVLSLRTSPLPTSPPPTCFSSGL